MKVIVLEGTDGTGKSKVANIVVQFLQECGLNAKYIHFPNAESPMGGHIYDLLHGKRPIYFNFNEYAAEAQHMLYALDRYEFFKEHGEELKDSILICDRYTTTSLVYQGAAQYFQILKREIDNQDDYEYYSNFTFEQIANESKFTRHDRGSIDKFLDKMKTIVYCYFGIPRPVLTFVIDRSAHHIAKTLSDKEYDSFETDSRYLQIVGQSLDYNAKREGWIHIDNNGSYIDAPRAIIDVIEKKANFTLQEMIAFKNKEKIMERCEYNLTEHKDQG
jgi:hypothetical protein